MLMLSLSLVICLSSPRILYCKELKSMPTKSEELRLLLFKSALALSS